MRKTFLMHTEWLDMFEAMDDESLTALIFAMFEYARNNAVIDLKKYPQAAVAFVYIAARMDEDFKRYAAAVESNRRKNKEAE